MLFSASSVPFMVKSSPEKYKARHCERALPIYQGEYQTLR